MLIKILVLILSLSSLPLADNGQNTVNGSEMEITIKNMVLQQIVKENSILMIFKMVNIILVSVS